MSFPTHVTVTYFDQLNWSKCYQVKYQTTQVMPMQKPLAFTDMIEYINFDTLIVIDFVLIITTTPPPPPHPPI